MKRTVFFISDRTGITAEILGRSLLTQFKQIQFHHVMLPYIDTVAKAIDVKNRVNQATQIDGNKALVFNTFVNDELRDLIKSSNALVIDLFETFIKTLEDELQTPAQDAIGLTHGMGTDSNYKTRMDAINFTINSDDGTNVNNYSNADIILIGVSRSGKTPTCLYLALQYGVKAANYPLTEDDIDAENIPALLKPYRSKLFGLTIDPIRLQQLRQERMANTRYASIKQCKYELNIVESIYSREKIHYIDTSNISIEEIATSIMQIANLQRQLGR